MTGLTTRPTHQRQLLVFLLFLHTVNTYMDRVCISTAKGVMMQDFGLSGESGEQTFGYVLGVFAIGYALFQIPAGWMADVFGPRRGLSLVVLIWSAFTALTGAVHRVWSLMTVRFLFGVGEAGAYPGATRALYRWLPVKERGLGQGIFHSGARIGAALSLFAMPWLIDLIGWRWTFVANGLVGIIWAAIWWGWFRDDPHQHPLTNDAERRLIEEGIAVEAADREGTDHIPFIVIVTSPNLLLAMFQYAASNITFFWSLSWLHSFMGETWGDDAAKLSALPLLVGAVSLWLSGSFVTTLYDRGHHIWSRRAPAMVGFGIGAVGMLVCTQFTSAEASKWAFIGCFSLAIFGVEMILSPSWSFCMDIGGERSGSVSGSMNMIGNLGAALSAIIYPFLKDYETGSPDAFFIFAAVMNVFAMLSWTMMNPWRKLRANLSSGERKLRWIAFFALIGGVVFALVYTKFLMGK